MLYIQEDYQVGIGNTKRQTLFVVRMSDMFWFRAPERLSGEVAGAY